MTALEQKLLIELERLEKERENEREAFKRSLKSLSERVAEEITETMKTLSETSYTEESNAVELLTTIVNQQSEIIDLLKKPPESDNLKQAIEESLNKFSTKLIVSLEQSLKELLN